MTKPGSRLRRWYVGISLVVFNSLVLVAMLNGLASVLATTLRDKALAAQAKTVSPAYRGWPLTRVTELLKETYVDTRSQYDLIAQVRERPMKGQFVTIAPVGYRMVADQGPWPPDRNRVNVFVFGGSTTFGYGVSDSESIPSQLQKILRARGYPGAYVYNFGRAAYTSTQETLELVALSRQNITPEVAVFIDGLNDCLWPNADPGWQFGDLLRQRIEWTQGPPASVALSSFALFQMAMNVGELISGPKWIHDEAAELEGERASFVVDRWLENVRFAERLGAAFGTRTTFVWQPVAAYHYDVSYHLLGQSKLKVIQRFFGTERLAKRVYPLIQKLESEGKLGGNVLYLGDMQSAKKENLYVDVYHYNAEFSSEIADLIVTDLVKKNMLQGKDHIPRSPREDSSHQPNRIRADQIRPTQIREAN